MEKVNLVAKPRTGFGKGQAKRLRASGLVPAIVYGHGMKPVPLQVGARDFYQALHTKAGENVVIHLSIDGVHLKESTCLIKELQHNPVTDEIAHVDLMVVSMTEKIAVKVPLVMENAADAPGVKEGGVLDVVHYEIEVECLPAQIPEKIVVDIKPMEIGDAVHARDLAIPQGVVCKLPAEEVIVALHPPAKAVEAAPEEEVTQPEVIEKGKRPEAEEGEGAAAPAKAAPAKPEKPAAKLEKKE